MSRNHELAVELRKLADLIEHTDHYFRVDFCSHPEGVQSHFQVLRLFDGLQFETLTRDNQVWQKCEVLDDRRLHILLFSPKEATVTA